MLRMATDGEVRNFVGVGPWPKTGRRLLAEHHDGLVPRHPRNRGAGRTGYRLTALQKLRPSAVRLPKPPYVARSFNVLIHSETINRISLFKELPVGGNYCRRRCRNPGDLFVTARPRAHAPDSGRGEGRNNGGRDHHPVGWIKSGIYKGGAVTTQWPSAVRTRALGIKCIVAC